MSKPPPSDSQTSNLSSAGTLLIAEHLVESGDLHGAEENFRTAVASAKLESDDSTLARAAAGLAFLLDNQDRTEEAREFYENAARIWQKEAGDKNLSFATLLNNLATIYKNEGLFDEAERHYMQALETYRAIHRTAHVDISTALNNLGVFYFQRGDSQRAEAMHIKALIIRQNVCRGIDPDLAQSYSNLAVIYHARGWMDKAENFYRKAINVLNDAAQMNSADQTANVDRRITMQNYADLLKLLGKEDQAAEIENSI